MKELMMKNCEARNLLEEETKKLRTENENLTNENAELLHRLHIAERSQKKVIIAEPAVNIRSSRIRQFGRPVSERVDHFEKSAFK